MNKIHAKCNGRVSSAWSMVFVNSLCHTFSSGRLEEQCYFANGTLTREMTDLKEEFHQHCLCNIS